MDFLSWLISKWIYAWRNQDSLVSLVHEPGHAEIRKQQLHPKNSLKCQARWWFQTHFFGTISHYYAIICYHNLAFYSVQPLGRNSICSDWFLNRLFASPRGYSGFELLGKKFCILYALCEQQLSKQRHGTIQHFNWRAPICIVSKSTNVGAGTTILDCETSWVNASANSEAFKHVFLHTPLTCGSIDMYTYVYICIYKYAYDHIIYILFLRWLIW